MSRFRSAASAALVLALAATAHAQAPRKPLSLGREAKAEELKAWDIDIRPDGLGLPVGQGSVKQGEEIFINQCAACHGEFGEGVGRWPALAGGRGTLEKENPDKTIGSFWPYSTTVFDYIRRTMPFGNAQSLSPDEVYAVTAFLLYINDIVNVDFVLSKDNLADLSMPNAAGFDDDDRETSERAFWIHDPCIKNCKTDVRVTSRARMIDVTPEVQSVPKVE